jgi:hypothetical protein
MKRIAELTAAQMGLEILRWICVLPAAVFASQAPNFAAAILRPPAVVQPAGFAPAAPPSVFRRALYTAVILPLSGAAFVVAGALVAPRFRRFIAIALAVLFAVLALLSHVLVHLPGTPHYDHFFATALAAAATAGAICYFDRPRA